MRKHWFLPEMPDVLATLNAQVEITVAGMEAFARWAQGESDQAAVVLAAEHDADEVRRELAQQLRIAFTTPVDQEDLFTLSERLDSVINMAKNVVRDADLLPISPSPATAGMAQAALEGVNHLARAIAALPKDPDAATAAAEQATKAGRSIEHRYSEAIREMTSGADPLAALLLREHFHDCLKVGERIELVADRIWYAVVKEQ